MTDEKKQIEKEFKVKREPKTSIGKAWNWVWHSDSGWSWLVALLLAFIIVKFVFFPILSLAFGTSLPLVVIESGSMSHPQGSFLGNTFDTKSAFDEWWVEKSNWYLEHNINNDLASEWPFKGGMEKGDIILVTGHGRLGVGDVIIFNADTVHPIIHRVIKIEEINSERVYSTKGDNNSDQLFSEKSIPENAVIGRAIFRIPKLGWIKLIFVELGSYFSR